MSPHPRILFIAGGGTGRGKARGLAMSNSYTVQAPAYAIYAIMVVGEACPGARPASASPISLWSSS